jgi:hypothetical protein
VVITVSVVGLPSTSREILLVRGSHWIASRLRREEVAQQDLEARHLEACDGGRRVELQAALWVETFDAEVEARSVAGQILDRKRSP